MEQAMMLLAGLGVPAGLIATLAWLRLIERLRLFDLIRGAAERQQAITADMVRALQGTRATSSRERDRRRGVMLSAFGAALAVLGLLTFVGIASVGGDEAVPVGVIIAGIGALPGCLGLGYVILSRSEREDGDA